MLKNDENFNASRRRFIRGAPQAALASRPPWSLPEARFVDQCTRCDDCVGRCPENILVKGSGGFPELDFRNGGCTFCGDCLAACEPGALSLEVFPAISWKVQVVDECLSAKGIVCRACGDGCDRRAIRFRLKTGGRADIELTSEACNGCGACIRPCPVGALRILPGSANREVA